MPKQIKLKTTIKCPVCKYKKELTMIEGVRLMTYDCPECKARLKTKSSECCIFCVYCSVPCTAAQQLKQEQIQKGEN